MDTDALVERLIDDGRQLVARLAEDGVRVTAACWVKPGDDQWSLYISTPLVDESGPLAAYQAIARSLVTLSDSSLSTSDIKLIGDEHPITKDVLGILQRQVGATRPRRPLLGGTAVDEVYVYPSARRGPHSELDESQKTVLVDLYARAGVAVDDLPYTDEMDQIRRDFIQKTGLALNVRDVFKALKNLGRQGMLGKLTRV